MSTWRAIKTPGAFPAEDVVLKVISLALCQGRTNQETGVYTEFLTGPKASEKLVSLAALRLEHLAERRPRHFRGNA